MNYHRAIRKNKGRPVNPTNRIILSEHGIRQGLFHYEEYSNKDIINFSVQEARWLRY